MFGEIGEEHLEVQRQLNKMTKSDLQAYGICPLGHNPRPSGETGDNISTTQIPEGEGRPLYWSTFHQKYVCSYHLRVVEDIKRDDKFHQKDLEIERKMQGMGIKKS